VEDQGTALPGTAITTHLTDAITYLYFQDHDGNIQEYLGGYDKWNSMFCHPMYFKRNDLTVRAGHNQILAKTEVQISTPLATAPSSKVGKPHLFYVGGGLVKDHFDGHEVAKYVPGRRLGAAALGGKVFLFHNALDSTEAISTVVYNGSAWVKGSTVVPA